MSEPPSGTVTFLVTDIEGSTRRWEDQPDAMLSALARHDALLRASIERNGGCIFKTAGDSFCAAFGAPGKAVAAAIDAQRELQSELWDDTGALRVRMAIHAGAAHELHRPRRLQGAVIRTKPSRSAFSSNAGGW